MEHYSMTCKFCSKEFDVEVTTMNNVPGGEEKEEINNMSILPRREWL